MLSDGNKKYRELYLKPRRLPVKETFFIISVFLMLWTLCRIVGSHGELIQRYFFYDTLDSGMDFFHSIEYLRGAVPYKQYHTLYPPLANLMFLGLSYFIPEQVIANGPLTFSESVSFRGTGADLRLHQSALLVFVFFFILVMLLIYAICVKIIGDDTKHSKICALCLTFSYGVVRAIDRGNILLLSVLLVLFFLYYYESENKILSELALVALALAAGLKIYPALFGLLLFRKKSYFCIVRTIIYGVLTVFLPLLFFNDRDAALSIWLGTMFSFASKGTTWWGCAFPNIVAHFERFMLGRFQLEIHIEHAAQIGYVIVAFLLIASVFADKKWKRSLLITMAMVLFSNQSDYIYAFFIVPLVFMLREEKTIDLKNAIPFFSLIGLTANLPVFYVFQLYYPRANIAHLAMLCILAWVFLGSIYRVRTYVLAKKSKSE